MATTFPCTGYVYKLYSDVDAQTYVGSTLQTLNLRYSEHVSRVNSGDGRKVYQHFRDIGTQHMYIEMLEELNYIVSDDHLHMHEGKWFDRLQPSLNTNHPYGVRPRDPVVTKQKKADYYQKNRDEIRAKQNASWTEESRAVAKERSKEYYAANKEKALAQQKAKREADKAADPVAFAAAQKAKYERTKDKENARRREEGRQRVACPDCGKEVSKSALAKHRMLHSTEPIVVSERAAAGAAARKAAMKQPIPCTVCGKQITKGNMSTHMKTMHATPASP